MFRSLFLALLLGTFWQANAQEDPVLQWTMRPLGTNTAYCAGLNDLTPTADGGVIVVGDALPSELNCWTGDFHDYMFYISKLDSFGRVEWELTLGDTMEYHSLRGVIPLDSSFIVGGFSEDQYGSLEGSARQFRKLFLARVTSQGDTIWTRTIPNICDNISQFFLQPLSNERFLVASEVFDSISWFSSNQARIIELDVEGNIIQETTKGLMPFSLLALETTLDEKILVGGFTQEIEHPNVFNLYLEKFEFGSDPDWFRYYPQFRYGYSTSTISNGKLAGWGYHAISDTFRLSIFNFLGLVDTTQYYEGETYLSIRDLIENNLNSLVAVGSTTGSAISNANSIMGFDQEGSLQWVKSLDLPGSQPTLRKIVRSREGVFYVIGKSGTGSFRGLVGRLSYRSLLPDPVITGPNQICTFTENTYSSNYPNEADQLWELAFENTAGDTLWIQQFADTSQVLGYGLEAGTLHICNTIYNELDTCISVQVGEAQLTETSIALCGEECFQAPDGSEVCEEGTHPFLYSDSFGCDSTVLLTIVRSPELTLTDTLIVGSTGTNDGSISVLVSGGTQPLSYSWDIGATGATVEGLNPGSYTVTVTDAAECTATFEFSVPLITATEELSDSQIELFPNPVSPNADLNLQTATEERIYSITLWQVNGVLVQHYPVDQNQGRQQFTLSAPARSGFYWLKIELKNGTRRWQKLLVL